MARDEREEARKVDTIERAMSPRNEFAVREMTDAELIERAFTHHPAGENERIYAAVRSAGKTLALTILNAVPKCADRTAAIRKVREAVMTANAGIALDGLI
jgi:hypothetical protein